MVLCVLRIKMPKSIIIILWGRLVRSSGRGKGEGNDISQLCPLLECSDHRDWMVWRRIFHSSTLFRRTVLCGSASFNATRKGYRRECIQLMAVEAHVGSVAVDIPFEECSSCFTYIMTIINWTQTQCCELRCMWHRPSLAGAYGERVRRIPGSVVFKRYF